MAMDQTDYALYPSTEATTPEQMADDIMFLVASYTLRVFGRKPTAKDDAEYRQLFAMIGERAWQEYERDPHINSVSRRLLAFARSLRPMTVWAA